eukprot:CAMPEP_0171962304 /NCGR_PEP_ID=MMETSP0993-20121228/168285_1 /TAXON_ID=483369 /ORGANISM="non described non described, Strain CCMP2098" /LENGTH=43 /DNA_ID= /DNA_START= /DNA_END= /DNA_ORIENTATION=
MAPSDGSDDGGIGGEGEGGGDDEKGGAKRHHRGKLQATQRCFH